MSSFSSNRLSHINIPLTALWLASVISVALGYFLMSSSNSDQAALYSAQSANYGKLLKAQSGSTLGGLLIAVGVLGLLLALAALTVTRGRVAKPDAVALGITEVDNENDAEPATAR